MRILTLAPHSDPAGKDPVAYMYAQIATKYPELNITPTNSKITHVQPAATVNLPNMKRIVMTKNSSPEDWYEFFYDCYNVSEVISKKPFTTEMLETVDTFTTSAQLVNFLGTSNSINVRAEDFWCSNNSIDYCGGEKTPNFLLEAKSDAIWYCGSLILNLWV